MILVDDRAGSKDLFPYIRALTSDAILTTIDAGDMAWESDGGPDGVNLRVGVEYKTIDDLLTCMLDGRFVGHQLIGLLENYDRRYLLVEGRIRCDRNSGLMQKLSGDRWRDMARSGKGYTYRELHHWFTSIEEFTQTRVAITYDEYESARWLQMKHSWYVNKAWGEHTTLQQFHIPPPPNALIIKPNIVRRVAKELTGIGWDRSMAVAAKFTSVREMINANEQTWREIDGIGKTIAQRIIAEISGRNR